MSLVLSNLSLAPALQRTARPLEEDTVQRIRDEILTILKAKSALLANTVELRIARQGTQNFVNMRVRRQYQSMLFHKIVGDTAYCFMASDKFDATVVLVALSTTSRDDPRLLQIPALHLPQIAGIVDEFSAFVRKRPLGFTYTTDADRRNRTLSHSRHFHLKIHFEPSDFNTLLPVMNLHENAVIATLDPVAYCRSRPLDTWADVIDKVAIDCSLRAEPHAACSAAQVTNQKKTSSAVQAVQDGGE